MRNRNKPAIGGGMLKAAKTGGDPDRLVAPGAAEA